MLAFGKHELRVATPEGEAPPVLTADDEKNVQLYYFFRGRDASPPTLAEAQRVGGFPISFKAAAAAAAAAPARPLAPVTVTYAAPDGAVCVVEAGQPLPPRLLGPYFHGEGCDLRTSNLPFVPEGAHAGPDARAALTPDERASLEFYYLACGSRAQPRSLADVRRLGGFNCADKPSAPPSSPPPPPMDLD
jgi:hypothetical protein